MENTTILADLGANPVLLGVVASIAVGIVLLAVVLYRDSESSQLRRKRAGMAAFEAVRLPRLLQRLGISVQAYVRQSDAAVLARQVRRCQRCRISQECEDRLLRNQSIASVLARCPNRSGIEVNRATVDCYREGKLAMN